MSGSTPDAEGGGLLQLSPEGVIGWSTIPTQPGELPRVIISVNGEPLATTLANRFDLEPVRRQIGTGIPGFAVFLARAPSGRPPFSVTLRSNQGNLLGSPLMVQSLEELALVIVGYQPVGIEGMVDRLVSGRLQGWVWNPSLPDQTIVVDVWDGMNLLGRAVCEQMRDDLRNAGKREGRCGFSFELPASLLDMQLHSIRVLVSGTSLELGNSPFEFGPTKLSSLLQEMVRLRQEVQELTARIGLLDAAEGRLQRNIMQVLAERLDAYAAIQQETIERSLENIQRTEPRLVSVRDMVARKRLKTKP